MSENGFKYLFVAIDYFSRFCILQPIENKRAETIASVIYSRIIADFTTPRSIITDNGRKFNNKILEELSKLFQVQKIKVQAYHPQSNGVVERLNKKIINCLRALINPYSIEWDKWIPTVKCALNAHVSAATGESPHYIIFGEDKLLPYELLNAEPQPIYNYDDYIAVSLNKLQLIHSRVREHMKTYREELKTQQHKIAREIKIDVGHLVMAKLHVPVAISKKLSPRFTGPYRVVENGGGNKYKIQDLKSLEVTIRHADDLKKVNMKIDAMVDDENRIPRPMRHRLNHLERTKISFMTVMKRMSTGRNLGVTHKDLDKVTQILCR